MPKVERELTDAEIAERALNKKIRQEQDAKRERDRLAELASDLSRKPASVRFEVPETPRPVPKEQQDAELAEFAKSISRPRTRISYGVPPEETKQEPKPPDPKPLEESRVVETTPSDSRRNEIVRYMPKRFDMKKTPRKTYRKEPITRIIKSGGTEVTKKSNGIKSCNISLNIKNKGSLTINNG
jgi:hypothetical protein